MTQDYRINTFGLMQKQNQFVSANLPVRDCELYIADMLCVNLSREFISKPPTRAAANGGRISAFPMTLWALSRWMN